jgi:hypothetical protein
MHDRQQQASTTALAAPILSCCLSPSDLRRAPPADIPFHSTQQQRSDGLRSTSGGLVARVLVEDAADEEDEEAGEEGGRPPPAVCHVVVLPSSLAVCRHLRACPAAVACSRRSFQLRAEVPRDHRRGRRQGVGRRATTRGPLRPTTTTGSSVRCRCRLASGWCPLRSVRGSLGSMGATNLLTR